MDIRIISGTSGRPVSHEQATRSLEVRSGSGQIARPGVARIAARGCRCCAAKTWIEGGRDSILPRVVIAGSCKKAKRAQLDHFTMQSVKFAVATLLFCKLICLIKTHESFWAVSELVLNFELWEAMELPKAFIMLGCIVVGEPVSYLHSLSWG
jgi:hypothetical protein